MRIVVNRGAIDQLMSSPAIVADLRARAGALAAACNTDSSWGGYVVDDDDAGNERPRFAVIDITAHPDDVRSLRLLRNMDAAR